MCQVKSKARAKFLIFDSFKTGLTVPKSNPLALTSPFNSQRFAPQTRPTSAHFQIDQLIGDRDAASCGTQEWVFIEVQNQLEKKHVSRPSVISLNLAFSDLQLSVSTPQTNHFRLLLRALLCHQLSLLFQPSRGAAQPPASPAERGRRSVITWVDPNKPEGNNQNEMKE